MRVVGYLATSMAGAAAASAGFVLALSSGATTAFDAEPNPAIMPVNVSTPMESEDPTSFWWLYPQGLLGSGTSPGSGAWTFTAPAPNALWRPSASSDPLARRCGLICNGAAGTAEHPDGQPGGWLIGSGGTGGTGGAGGVGGHGGTAEARYRLTTSTTAVCRGTGSRVPGASRAAREAPAAPTVQAGPAALAGQDEPAAREATARNAGT